MGTLRLRLEGRRSTRTAGTALLSLLLGGCLGYRPAPLDVERPLRETARPPEPLTYEAAVRFAVEHDPDLLALRARAEAVNVSPPKEPIEVGAGVDADHRFQADASLDALSLLGLGTRNSERALACARRSEAWIAHHQRVREVAGEIAEAFAVEAAFAALPATPRLDTDAAAYVRAGLEGSVAESAAKATQADREVEDSARATERRANRLALARRLGVRGEVVPAGLPPGFPPVDPPVPAVVVRARAEVQRRIAAFEVADRQVWRAVAGQYPAVLLEPGIAADPASLFGAVRLRIPVGAGREVTAAHAAREAARQDVEGAVLDALREADESRTRWEAAELALAAARGRLDAEQQLFRASLTRAQVAGGPVIETVAAADTVVESARSLREAAVEAARARVRAAIAAGWPSAPPK